MIINTERLILRDWQAEDFDQFALMMADEETAKWTSPFGPDPLSRALAWRQFATVIGHRQLRGYTQFAVEDRQSGKIVGQVGPWMPEGWPGLEVGWTIIAEARGKGYAVEAAKAAVKWVFENQDIDQVISLVDPANTASAKVAEKIGEKIVSEAEVIGHKCLVYAITREEFGVMNTK